MARSFPHVSAGFAKLVRHSQMPDVAETIQGSEVIRWVDNRNANGMIVRGHAAFFQANTKVGCGSSNEKPRRSELSDDWSDTSTEATTRNNQRHIAVAVPNVLHGPRSR